MNRLTNETNTNSESQELQIAELKKSYMSSRGETAKDIEDRLRMMIHDLRSPLLLVKMLMTKLEADLENQKTANNNPNLQIVSDSNSAANTARKLSAPAMNLLSLEEVSALVSACGRMNTLINSSWEAKKPVYIPTRDYLSLDGFKNFIMEKQIEYRNDPGVSIRLQTTPYIEGVAPKFHSFWRLPGLILTRVLSNLINNSVEARRGDKVNITVEIDDDYRISVIDDGVGIPAEMLAKLGTQVITFGKEGLPESGSGMGLYGSHKLLEPYGGIMRIFPVEGGGTKIRIFIPYRINP